MKRFVEGVDRSQNVLFPARLDDYIEEDHPVRVIDVFVDELDLRGLGFAGVEPASTGRPAYHPATLLKVYIYGYLNRVQSSRRLEREAQRNIELIWLTGRCIPDFKTIADFRKNNGVAIRRVCSHFIVLCRQMKLFTDTVVAIDGSKFKAVNSRDKNLTQAKLKARLEQLEASVARYLAELDRADRAHGRVPAIRVKHLTQKITAVREQVKQLNALGKVMQETPDKQVSQTDPDARAMATHGRGSGIVGYNVQAAVEATHHLIVAHEVTNEGHDRHQLTAMALRAREAMDQDTLVAVADRGYYKGEELLACEQVGITPLVPKPLTSNSRANGRFDKRDFYYLTDRDAYQCPAGEQANWRMRTIEGSMNIDVYWSSACPNCPLRDQCTTARYRRIRRWEHESVLETLQCRLDERPDAMRVRRQTVEHIFGTLKAWMGSTHFLMRTLPKVATEMSLHVLAYNMKRVMKIMGIKPLMQAIMV
ncbi:IS1182 family transposase [Rhodanobacter sp. A1T4]|uniref:IS1182 family transposase n=1 Tax=Rhodanobacter sp. A1T4 TaxID=2723087 RepID=UPI001620E60B|nr:IS1182 family transposase [Rhodanobacter sp. A1T4]MBB6249466.1 transposase [Rhodanobacter sp. A1T4]